MNLALAHLDLPIRIRPDRPMTDPELEQFSRDNKTFRIEREASGELIVMSPTGSEGGSIKTEVATELMIWARVDGRGKVFGSNAGFTLPDNSVRAADAAWVSLERWNALTVEQRRGFAPLCPEFVVEIRSETDRLPAVREKIQLWLTSGAELAWLIDPLRRAVEIYRLDEPAESMRSRTPSREQAQFAVLSSFLTESGPERLRGSGFFVILTRLP